MCEATKKGNSWTFKEKLYFQMANIWLSSRWRTVRQQPGWCGRRRRGLRQFTTGEELSANDYRCSLCIWRIIYLSCLQPKCSLIFDCRLEEEAERADRVAEIAEAEARRCRLRNFNMSYSNKHAMLTIPSNPQSQTFLQRVIKSKMSIFLLEHVWISFLQAWRRVSCSCRRC